MMYYLYVDIFPTVSEAVYRQAIGSGTAWRSITSRFTREHRYHDGVVVASVFVGYARRRADARELELCYSFLLVMLDRAQLPEEYCLAYIDALSCIMRRVVIDYAPYMRDRAYQELIERREGPRVVIHPMYRYVPRFIHNRELMRKGRARFRQPPIRAPVCVDSS